RSTEKLAFSRIACTSSFGISPNSAHASQAKISTSNQALYLFSSVQIAPSSGRVYRSITQVPPHISSSGSSLQTSYQRQMSHAPFYASLSLLFFRINEHLLLGYFLLHVTLVPYLLPIR